MKNYTGVSPRGKATDFDSVIISSNLVTPIKNRKYIIYTSYFLFIINGYILFFWYCKNCFALS